MEADELGLNLMANGCFDIQESALVMKRLGDMTGTTSVSDAFSTHPSMDKRVKELNKLQKLENIQTISKRCGNAIKKAPAYYYLSKFHYDQTTLPIMSKENLDALFSDSKFSSLFQYRESLRSSLLGGFRQSKI